MPLVTSTIPNLINGVSQQPASLRLASQAEQVVNCMSSPVEGLKKRPPAQHIKRLFTGSVGNRRPFVHVVDRDESTRYMVLLQDNSIRVFDLDGTEKTVSTPNGTGYLGIAGEPSAQFRVASVADYTFIVNREKTVAMLTGSGDLAPSSGSKGVVFVRSAEYDTTYKVKVNSTEVSYKTQPPGGRNISASYSQSLTTVTVTATAHGLLPGDQITFASLSGNGVNGTYTIATAAANTFTYAAAQSQTTSGNCSINFTLPLSTVDIAAGLRNSLATALGAGWTITQQDYVIVIVKNDGADYVLGVGDSRNGEAMRAIKGTVEGMNDLPTVAPHGLIVKVQGSKETSYDDYYVRFDANAGSGTGPGIWKETVAPGIAYKLNPATMPHVLVREANGTFTFKRFDWSPRLAGDADVSPDPSFVGYTINNVTLFRNRLVFLSDENVILSAADSYDRFFPSTVQTVVDSDPIDLTCGGNRINILLSAMPFASTLMLFSRHGQFRLDGGTTVTGQALTPKTANITQMTAFEMSPEIDPVAAGRTIYFAIPRGEFSGVREFFLPEATSPIPDSEEVTASVPRYIPASLSTMIATISEEAIIAISKDQPKRLYLYKFFFQNEERLQNAWSYWEYEGAKSILGADFVDSDLYLVMQYADGVYLERTVIRPENVDAGAPIELLVDRKADETLCTTVLSNPAGLDLQSTITLPYPINAGSRMIVVGRYANGNTLQPGQVVEPISQTSNTITVRGDLTASKFFVGERYDMLYEFSTQYLKEQPPGGGMSVISGPRLQLRTWTMIFDQASSFQIRVTPRSRDPLTYAHGPISLGDQSAVLGGLSLRTNKFRVPVMAQNTDAKVEVVSDSPLPCRLQSAEWEGWYHSRSQRL